MTLPDRFWDKVEKTDTCWLWTAAMNNKGYGRFSLEGRLYLPHRLAWEDVNGPIPEGKVLDHFVCETHRCVRPDHIRPVTSLENTLRGNSQGSKNAAKTHCKRGHALTPDNLYKSQRGHRDCIACKKARRKKEVA